MWPIYKDGGNFVQDIDEDEPLALEIAHFVDCIISNKKCLTDANHAKKVIKILSVLGGTIATADAVITAKVGSTAMTGGTITIAHSGSNTGDIDTCEPTAANIVEEGGYVTLTTSGASTNTHTADFTIVVRR